MIGSQLWRDEGDGALSLADCRNMNSEICIAYSWDGKEIKMERSIGNI